MDSLKNNPWSMWLAKTWSFGGLRFICFIYLFFSELERLSNLVGKPSENHPLHNSGLLSLDPVQDKTPLYSQLLQAYKWSNKVREACQKWSWYRKSHVFLTFHKCRRWGWVFISFFCSWFKIQILFLMGLQSWKLCNFSVSYFVVLWSLWGLVMMLR